MIHHDLDDDLSDTPRDFIHFGLLTTLSLIVLVAFVFVPLCLLVFIQWLI